MKFYWMGWGNKLAVKLAVKLVDLFAWLGEVTVTLALLVDVVVILVVCSPILLLGSVLMGITYWGRGQVSRHISHKGLRSPLKESDSRRLIFLVQRHVLRQVSKKGISIDLAMKRLARIDSWMQRNLSVDCSSGEETLNRLFIERDIIFVCSQAGVPVFPMP